LILKGQYQKEKSKLNAEGVPMLTGKAYQVDPIRKFNQQLDAFYKHSTGNTYRASLYRFLEVVGEKPVYTEDDVVQALARLKERFPPSTLNVILSALAVFYKVNKFPWPDQSLIRLPRLRAPFGSEKGERIVITGIEKEEGLEELMTAQWPNLIRLIKDLAKQGKTLKGASFWGFWIPGSLTTNRHREWKHLVKQYAPSSPLHIGREIELDLFFFLERHTRTDTTNLVRIAENVLIGLFYEDDSQVIRLRAVKEFGDLTGTYILVIGFCRNENLIPRIRKLRESWQERPPTPYRERYRVLAQEGKE